MKHVLLHNPHYGMYDNCNKTLHSQDLNYRFETELNATSSSIGRACYLSFSFSWQSEPVRFPGFSYVKKVEVEKLMEKVPARIE